MGGLESLPALISDFIYKIIMSEDVLTGWRGHDEGQDPFHVTGFQVQPKHFQLIKTKCCQRKHSADSYDKGRQFKCQYKLVTLL